MDNLSKIALEFARKHGYEAVEPQEKYEGSYVFYCYDKKTYDKDDDDDVRALILIDNDTPKLVMNADEIDAIMGRWIRYV